MLLAFCTSLGLSVASSRSTWRRCVFNVGSTDSTSACTGWYAQGCAYSYEMNCWVYCRNHSTSGNILCRTVRLQSKDLGLSSAQSSRSYRVHRHFYDAGRAHRPFGDPGICRAFYWCSSPSHGLLHSLCHVFSGWRVFSLNSSAAAQGIGPAHRCVLLTALCVAERLILRVHSPR
jgi:hypothetical protein